MGVFKFLICVGLLTYQNTVFGQEGRAQCLPATIAGDEFQFVFRFARQGDTTINQLGFYDSSIAAPTDATTIIQSTVDCPNSTLDANGIIRIGLSVDGDAALPCGITKSGNTYTITIAILSSPPTAFRFTCTTGAGGNLDNFPTSLSITNFDTGNIENKLAYQGNQESLQFHVFHADGNKSPAKEVRLAERIQLRVVHDKDYQDGPDNWGRVFHTAFISHQDAEISLHIYTRGVGTRVKVTGSLAGETFTHYYPVKRDVETKILIPTVYKPSSVASTVLDPRAIALKVEVEPSNTYVAVRVQTKSSSSSSLAGEFMALPDNVLGVKYNCYTGSSGVDGGQIVIYVVEDATSLTINFNAFDITGFTINGIPVTPTQVVSMNENDVMNIQCGATCGLITLQADKPIGVVTGHENSAIAQGQIPSGTYVSQIPPVSTYGKVFVLNVDNSYQIVLEDSTSTVNYTRASGVVTNVPSGARISANPPGEYFVFDSPVLLISSIPPGLHWTMPYPSISQWSTRYYIYVTNQPFEGHFLRILAQTGEHVNITIFDTGAATEFGSNTLGSLSVSAAAGTLAYEVIYASVEIIRGPALIEIKTGSNSKPFFVDAIRVDDNINQYMPVGIRYPTINPCVQSPSITDSFGTVSRQNVPGDLLDNDCNGLVDDQLNDGTNSGADLAPHPVNENRGIYVNTLIVSNNAMFPTDGSARTKTLITNGCATSLAGALGIQPFTWNRGIGEQFTTYHVMDTQPFRAFSLGTPTLYLRVNIGFCTGNLTGSKCDNSCQTPTTVGRKRRQIEDTVDLETQLTLTDVDRKDQNGNVTYVYRHVGDIELETQLTLTDVDRKDQNGLDATCTMNTLYWIPACLLLLTILIEAVMNCVFLYIKTSINRLK